MPPRAPRRRRRTARLWLAPTALRCLGLVAGQPCADDPAFLDETGQPCALWHNPGFDCATATSARGYRPEGQAALMAACPDACDSCDLPVDCVGAWARCGEGLGSATLLRTRRVSCGHA